MTWYSPLPVSTRERQTLADGLRQNMDGKRRGRDSGGTVTGGVAEAIDRWRRTKDMGGGNARPTSERVTSRRALAIRSDKGERVRRRTRVWECVRVCVCG